jgi:hypothetical protein
MDPFASTNRCNAVRRDLAMQTPLVTVALVAEVDGNDQAVSDETVDCVFVSSAQHLVQVLLNILRFIHSACLGGR